MRVFCILIVVILIGCSKSNQNMSPAALISPEADLIFKTDNLQQFYSNLKTSLHSFGSSLPVKSSIVYIDLAIKLNLPQSTYISISKSKNDSLFTSFVSKKELSNKITDSLFKTDTLNHNSKTILKYSNTTSLFLTEINGYFICSSSLSEIQRVCDQKLNATDIDFNKAFSLLENSKDTAVLINHPSTNLISADSLSSINHKLGLYAVFDIELNQNNLATHGVILPSEPSDTINLTQLLQNYTPSPYSVQTITPNAADGFISISQRENLANKAIDSTATIKMQWLSGIVELGEIYSGTGLIQVLKTSDTTLTKSILPEHTLVENFRQKPIYKLDEALVISNASTLLNKLESQFFCILDDFFLFAAGPEALQYCIVNYQNQTTLNQNPTFLTATEQLSTEASLTVVNTAGGNNILPHNLLNSVPIKEGNISALQLVADDGFFHVHSTNQKKKNTTKTNTVNEELEITLDNPLLNQPKFVKNYANKQLDISVQDVTNKLHVFSNKGSLLMTVKVEGEIIGDIQQVDAFKNGRLQYAFVTQNKLYLIDKNGQHVSPFPLSFKDAITQPLALFDYDNNKNYRLVVTQGNELLMYDIKGAIVKGFTFSKAKAKLITPPKHFRLKGNDYIVFKTSNKLYILDRLGKIRVPTSDKNELSNTAIFNYQDAFTTTTNTGELLQISTSGKTTTKKLGAKEIHSLFTTNKTLALQSENKLLIKSKTIDVDLGNYTPVQIFYLNDKIYVALTDLQSQKILIYDSQATLIPNFPVYGNSTIDMANMDKDSSLEFVTKGSANSFIVYKLN